MPQTGPASFFAAFALAALLAVPPVAAQAPPPVAAQAPPPAAATQPVDPVVARVNGVEIRLSDVSEAAQQLPAEMRSMPPAMLFPMLLDQMIDRVALVALARKRGLDREPDIARQIIRAQEQALQTALIGREVGPLVSEAAVRTRYDRDIAGKPGDEEVHARHILVPNEADARKIIVELKKGGDFAALAKTHSADKGSAGDGDLGFFKKVDMVPEFATAAFLLKPGEVTDNPVKTQFGWHVIRVEARRTAPAPSFEDSYETLRQKMIQENVELILKEARTGLAIEKFNVDGSPVRATDTAEPPAAPARR